MVGTYVEKKAGVFGLARYVGDVGGCAYRGERGRGGVGERGWTDNRAYGDCQVVWVAL